VIARALTISWGASIIDTLDSLLVFGLDEEYKLCRPFVNQLNFHWVGGKDWSQGYMSTESLPHPDDEDRVSEQVYGTDRDKSVSISVFETTIRYLGGLLGAYDLSGDQLLMDRAVDLATVLERAFNTQSGLPAGHMNPGYETNFLAIGSLSIAEAASISLEFMRLAQVTDDRKWHDLAQRVTDYIETHIIPRSTMGNLIPLSFQPESDGELYGTFSWGGMADSYYEYLIKTYKLLGGGQAAQQYRKIYEQSVDAARKFLFFGIDLYDWSPPHRAMMGIGKFSGQQVHEIEHLTCFAGGMLGMGSKLLDRPQDLVDGEKFTQACYWLSAATPTGLQPESVVFYEPGHEVWENVTIDGYSYLPPTPEEKSLGIEFEERIKGVPTGSKSTITRGINRPETIESIFYM
jgi:mannosyl-oligosaccharide alpha-1,2-mannosidase